MSERIRELLREGESYNEIVRLVGCSKATVSYHAKKLGMVKARRIYDWAEVQSYHEAGHSRLQCMRHFGFCADAWERPSDAVRLYPSIGAFRWTRCWSRGDKHGAAT